MAESKSNVLQGTLDLLILKALTAGELHGLGVSRRIEQITRGTFSVQPGSLFPALHRLEEAGALTSSWQPSENNRRAKFYALTKTGRHGSAMRRRSGTALPSRLVTPWRRNHHGVVSTAQPVAEPLAARSCRERARRRAPGNTRSADRRKGCGGHGPARSTPPLGD